MVASVPKRLARMVERERAEREQTYCLDELECCDLCGGQLLEFSYAVDGQVRGMPQLPIPDGSTMGQWAYMCPNCFEQRGVAIEWGCGQLYERQTTGDWLLVGGFPPESNDSF